MASFGSATLGIGPFESTAWASTITRPIDRSSDRQIDDRAAPNKTFKAPLPKSSQCEDPKTPVRNLGSSKLQCGMLAPIQSMFVNNHIRSIQLDETFRNKVIGQFIKNLDPQKVVLLKSDVAQIHTALNKVFERIQAGDCSSLSAALKIAQARTNERTEATKKILGLAYRLNETAELKTPLLRDYPASPSEADQLLKTQIDVQVASYIALGHSRDEARMQVQNYWSRLNQDLKTISDGDLYSHYMNSFAHALDPHSDYLSPSDDTSMQAQLRHKMFGIGVELSFDQSTPVLKGVIPGTPAEKSGKLQPGDRIVGVAQGTCPFLNVNDLTPAETLNRLRGEKGSPVRLLIQRKEQNGMKQHELSVVRDEIKLESASAKMILREKIVGGEKKKIAIISMNNFYSDGEENGRSSSNDIRKLLEIAKTNGAKGVVLDLTNNPGGLLDEALRTAGLFIGPGNTAQVRSKGVAQIYNDPEQPIAWDGSLVVLTNPGSASASEIVAGTLKDYRRAVVVGNAQTFGKGSVQSIVPIPERTGEYGAIKITHSIYFTPSGQTPQRQGVPSDVVLPGRDSRLTGERSLDNSIPPTQVDDFRTDMHSASWVEISDEWKQALSGKSRLRVTQNPEFQKIAADLEKMKKEDAVIRVAEILSSRKTSESDKPADTKKNKFDRADINEASEVLFDLLELRRKTTPMR